MQTFKTQAFARFADREGLEDAALCEAVRRARDGLIDADLGGGVIKQRIARKGGGRSGGFRTIVVFRRGRAGVLRARVCEERPGEPSAQGALGGCVRWRKSIWRWTRQVSRRCAGGWRDNRGGMR